MISEKFLQYCHKHPSLLRWRPNFKVYLGGGMAVKLYLMSLNKPVPREVGKTRDFDFTFAVDHPLSEDEVSKYSLEMYNIMYNFIKGFTRPDALKIKSYERKSLIPSTGKRTYHVIEFGKDFVDCTLAYVPDARRVLLKQYGLPISSHLYRDVLAVLTGSFVYTKIKPRNPIFGERKEKGLRNLARVKAIRRLRSATSDRTLKFISAIKHENLSASERHARAIIKHLTP